METYILAIDHGTTSTRAILFSKAQEIVAVAQKEGSVEYPKPGWVVQDANQIWNDTMSAISDVLDKASVQPNQIAGIGISNQRETTLMWDRRTGLPVDKAIVWQSRQTADICDEWKRRGFEPYVRATTGLRIDPYFSASKITYLLRNNPGLREEAEAGEILFGTMDTWLVWKLTEGYHHVTDASNASRTMLCDIENLRWDNKLLSYFDIPDAILPNIVGTSEIIGTTSPHVFFQEEVPIASIVGDQQAALFGQLALEAGQAKNTYGTGGFLLMNTGENIVQSSSGLLSTVAWKIGDSVTYALEGSIFVSGSIMKWMRDQLHLFDDVCTTCAMAEEAKTTGGVYIIPAFVGLGAPFWDERAKASISGLTLGTNRNQLVRAALESMAYQARDVTEAMVRDSGFPITHLKVDGGAAVNDFLLQFQSDLLQVPVERFKINELTALGAAFLAGLAVGYWSKDELRIESEHVFVPQRERAEMDNRYKDWLNAVDACKAFKPEML